MKITYQQYREELDSIADSILDRCEETGEYASDVMLEYTDSHQWVTYYWAHQYVMEHTVNEDAVFDAVGGVPPEALERGWLSVRGCFVAWAFCQDVCDVLAEREEEREEEQR